MVKIKKVLMTDQFIKSLEKLDQPRKKSKKEIAEEKAVEAVTKSAEAFNWSLPCSFAKLWLPILDHYIQENSKIYDWSWKVMTNKERRYCAKCDEKHLETWWYKRIKKKRLKQFKDRIWNVYKALYDMSIEGTEDWEKQWNMKEYGFVDYDIIPVEGSKGLYERKLKPEYKKVEEKNRKIMKYNIKQEMKCYKWRKEQLKWFVENLWIL